MIFRNLYADEIDVRIATINEKGATLLLYKDARVDQNILDEYFGIFGWQRHHTLIGDRLYCTVSVKDPDTGEWIEKQDVGVESYTEKEKGQASDAFKRACFNFGIGRELYTAPFVWVPCEKYEVKKKDNKPVTYDRFKVQEITYTDNKITSLVIVNASKKGEVVYSFGKSHEEKVAEKISDEVVAGLKIACSKKGAPESVVCNAFKVSRLEDINVADYTKYRSKITGLLEKWVNENKG